MNEPDLEPVEWVPCAPMFVETSDGFALTDAARALLDPPAPSVLERIAALRAAVGAVAADLPAEVRRLTAAELFDVLEALQETSNVVGFLDQCVVAAIDRNPDTEKWGHSSTAMLLVDRLHVRPSEAKRRVGTARACTERVALDGSVEPPLRPQVAAAQAAGAITPDHAHVIVRALGWLPRDVAVESVDGVEAALVGAAGRLNASDVAALGRAARDRFDPDGPEPRDREYRRRRGITLTRKDDGPGRITGDLTPELFVKLMAVLSALAAPRPDDGNGPDDRSHPQRMHDAVEDVCDRLLRSDTLPDCGGVPATITVTMTQQQLERWIAQTTGASSAETTTGAGTAAVDTAEEMWDGRVHTSFGDISIAEALRMASEAEIIPIVVNDAGGIMSHGRSKRLATPAQTKALRARDRGCTFPGCLIPPEWCERHHVIAWLLNGPTDIDNLALVCGHHHRNFQTWGWQCVMKNDVPWWIPPPELDPAQEPLRNQAHLATV